MKALSVLLLAFGLVAASAQPSCRVYKAFNAAANTGMVQDTINVADNVPMGSAKVMGLMLGHPAVATLQMSLLHRSSPDAVFTSSALSFAADAMGTYNPATPVNSPSAKGQWVLRIVDSQPGAEQRLISLTSWTLQLCPADAPVQAADGQADVSVDVSKDGVSVDVSKGDDTKSDSKSDDKSDDTKSDRSFKVVDGAKGLLEFVFPGLKKDDFEPTGVLGVIYNVHEAGRNAIETHVEDSFKLVEDVADVYKGYVSKKIGDVVGYVNSAGSAAEGFIGKRGGLFGTHDKSLRGFIANLKEFVGAEVKGTIDTVLGTATALSGLHSSLTGDWKSSTGAVTQLLVAALSNVGKLYITVEGAASTHINNAISAKAAILEGLLDKIIAALQHVEDSKFTGPVADISLNLSITKLEALAAALDKVDAAIKLLPTPSRIIAGAFNTLGNLWQQTHAADLFDIVDDGPIIGRLMDKVDTARDLLKKATPKVAATSGN